MIRKNYTQVSALVREVVIKENRYGFLGRKGEPAILISNLSLEDSSLPQKSLEEMIWRCIHVAPMVS